MVLASSRPRMTAIILDARSDATASPRDAKGRSYIAGMNVVKGNASTFTDGDHWLPPRSVAIRVRTAPILWTRVVVMTPTTAVRRRSIGQRCFRCCALS